MKPGNDKYSLLIEHLPDAFAYHQIITDDEGNPADYIFLDVNRAFEEMFNLPRSAVVGKKITAVFPNIKAAGLDWIDTFGKVALTGETLHFEHHYKPRNRWYDITAYSDTPGFFVVLFRDITDKKRMEEEALKESKEKYLLLSENVSDVIWTADLNLKYTYVSQSGEKIFGYTAEEFLSFSVEKTLTQKSRDLALQVFHEEMAVEQLAQKDLERTRTIELEHICKSGSTVWFEVKMSFLRDREGYATGILGISRDITERKKIEKMHSLEEKLKETDESLHESEQRFRYIAEFSPLPLAIVDEKGKYEYLNPQFTEIFGYTLADIPTGKKWFKLAYPDPAYRQQVVAAWKKYQEELVKNVASPRSFTVTCKNGTNKETLFRTVIMDNGKHLVIYEDITERKLTERIIEARLNLLTFASSNPLDTVLQQTLDEVCNMLNSPIGFYHFVSADERTLTLKAWSTDTLKNFCNLGNKSGMHYSVDEAGVWVDCIHERRPVIHNDYATLPHRKGIPEDHAMVKRELVVPIMRSERIVAILGVGNKPQDYTEKDIQIVSYFADVAWEIAEDKLAEQKLADYTLELEQLYRHLDAELDKARQVHERTLPTALPNVEGISFAAHYQPAQKMGGDLYDVIHKDNKLIFYISDVSGHSLDGAMLSVFIKGAINSYINLKSDQISPRQILKHLSIQYGRENYDEELYFCIFMAVLDLGTLELSYCSAGFQQEMLLRLGNGETMQLATKELFITSYMPPETLILKEETVVITPGTTIFLTSDGLTEQGSQGAYYRDRLPDIFYANAHLSAHLVAKAVVEDFRQFNNGFLQGKDDITFLVLQVHK